MAADRAVAECGTIDEPATESPAGPTARQGRASALLMMLVYPAIALGCELLWRADPTALPAFPISAPAMAIVLVAAARSVRSART